MPVGNRVLFMVEPGCEGITWPELHCFDADTGTLVWKTPVDPLAAFPELTDAKRQEVSAAVESLYEQGRTTYRICRPLMAVGGAKADHPAVLQANKELAEHGMTIGSYTPGYGLLRKLRMTDDRRKKWASLYNPYGIKPECTWQGFGANRVGLAFSTPVTDGKSVWVMTYHGTLASFDVATGKQRWSIASGYKGHHGLLASPRLWNGMVIAAWFDTSAFDPIVLACDQATGQKRWETRTPTVKVGRERIGRPGGSPVILDLKGTPVILCSPGRVIRAADGFVYETEIGPTSINTWGMDDKTDTIFFQTGGDNIPGQRVALELSLDGDSLAVKERWGHKGWNEFASSVFASGRLFTSRVQLDPATGFLLGNPTADTDRRKVSQNSPLSKHLLLVANGHVYGFREEKTKATKDKPEEIRGICEVYTLDGKKVSANTLAAAKREGPQLDRFRMQGWPDSSFSACCAMNIGDDRLYLVSDDYLYCIGEK